MPAPLKPSNGAYGGNGGASTGGYEQTDPDYVEHKLARLRREYKALAPQWRECFLGGLSRFEQDVVTGRKPIPGI